MRLFDDGDDDDYDDDDDGDGDGDDDHDHDHDHQRNDLKWNYCVPVWMGPKKLFCTSYIVSIIIAKDVILILLFSATEKFLWTSQSK